MHPIKFELGIGRKLDFDTTTCTTFLPQLGALMHTECDRRFGTDRNGLIDALLRVDSATSAYAGHIQTIGTLLADGKSAGYGDEVLQDLGRMLASFGNHLQYLNKMQVALNEALEESAQGGSQ